MAGTFQAGETIICSVVVKDANGALQDPVNSMNIAITGTGIANVAMTHDATGRYHYDFQSAPTNAAGYYDITYTAIDGTRTTIEKDNFKLE